MNLIGILLPHYYYEDGSTSQTEEFLYNTCDPISGGSGGGGQGNDIEYEFQVYRIVQWPVYTFPDGIYQVISIENMKGRKVAGEYQGGHFISSSHQSDQCNQTGGVWGASYWNVPHSDYIVLSHIIGDWYPASGTHTHIDNSRNWSFHDIFP